MDDASSQSFKSISLRPRPPCDGGENECFGYFMHQVIFKGIQGPTLPSGKVRILFLRTYDCIYRNRLLSVNLTIGTTVSSLKLLFLRTKYSLLQQYLIAPILPTITRSRRTPTAPHHTSRVPSFDMWADTANFWVVNSYNKKV